MNKKLILTVVVLSVLLLVGCKEARNESEQPSSTTKANKISISQDNRLTEEEQRIIDNYHFLNSVEGRVYQAESWKFAYAYLSGDVGTVERPNSNRRGYKYNYSTESTL